MCGLGTPCYRTCGNVSTCFEEKIIDSAAVQQNSVYALESPTPVDAIFEMAENSGRRKCFQPPLGSILSVVSI